VETAYRYVCAALGLVIGPTTYSTILAVSGYMVILGQVGWAQPLGAASAARGSVSHAGFVFLAGTAGRVILPSLWHVLARHLPPAY
jgi:hypothetical protein